MRKEIKLVVRLITIMANYIDCFQKLLLKKVRLPKKVLLNFKILS
jgi:hypothetical protein